MTSELVHGLADASLASSWGALFATVWFNRQDLRRGKSDPAGSLLRQASSTAATEATDDSVGDPDLPDLLELDLFPSTPRRAGARFDDTVASPIDAPRRLDAVIRAAGLRLRALPELKDLGHRTIAYRASLEQIVREAAQARARLADGTYGACRTCTRYISLARLCERPWARLCVYCDLAI